MINTPLAALNENRRESLATALAVAIALILPFGLALLAMSVQNRLEGWLIHYQPVVYFSPSASDSEIQAIADEVGTWKSVRQVELPSPEQLYRSMEKDLASQSLQDLGITPEMLPRTMMLTPSVDLAGHIRLAGRVEGLRTRMEVQAVDVPGPQAMAIIRNLTTISYVALLLSLFGLFSAFFILRSFLTRLREKEADLNKILHTFGASDLDLARPSVIRGAALGLWGGLLGAAFLFTCLILLGSSFEFAGPAAGSQYLLYGLASGPFLLGPLLGTVAAQHQSRNGRGKGERYWLKAWSPM